MLFNSYMDKVIITLLIEKIKQNKKYKTLSDDIVEKEILSFLNTHPQLKKERLKKKEVTIIVKEVRKRLHRLYGQYQTKKKNSREEFLADLLEGIEKRDNILIKESVKQILATTLSTKERQDDYETIYQKIFAITGPPKIIVDLGAGLNLFSFPFMNLPSLTYYAYDIDEKDIKFLNNYLHLMDSLGLHGNAEILDIKACDLEILPDSDIVFMFKLVDLIDTKKKKFSRSIIKNLFEKNKTLFVVASFATRTLTRKKMNLPKRIGFESMLKQLNLSFMSFSTDNEIFYVISNQYRLDNKLE